MPIIKVELLAGRSLEQKRRVVRDLTDSLVDALGVSESSVQVHLVEMDPGDVGIGGELVGGGGE